MDGRQMRHRDRQPGLEAGKPGLSRTRDQKGGPEAVSDSGLVPSPRAEEDSLLTIAQAAQYLNVTERFIRRLVAERRVVYHKLGKFVRFRREDLDAFLTSGRVERPEVLLLRPQRVWHAR